MTLAGMAVASAGAFASLEDMKQDIATETAETRSAWTRRLATFAELESAARLDDLAASLETGDPEIARITLAAAGSRIRGTYEKLHMQAVAGLGPSERSVVEPALGAAMAESSAALVEAEGVLGAMEQGDPAAAVQAAARLERKRSDSAAALISARDHLRRLRGTDVLKVEHLSSRVQTVQTWLAIWSLLLVFAAALRGRDVVQQVAPRVSLMPEAAPSQRFADAGLRRKGAA